MQAFRRAALLDKSYLKERAKLIDMKRAQDFGRGKPPQGGTVYLTAADASGMMVSMIQSNYMGFGSGVVVRTASRCRTAPPPSCCSPATRTASARRKRPYQTIIPGFVTRDGKPVMSFGVMGGTMQPQGHAQVMVRIADYGQNPQAACDGPRFRFVQGMDVSVEDGGFPPATLEELQRRGHRIVTDRRLQPVRQRADDLEARRRLLRRQRPAPRRPGRRFLKETGTDHVFPDSEKNVVCP